MWNDILAYFSTQGGRYLQMLLSHISVSVISLLIAVAIGVPSGWLCVRFVKAQRPVTAVFSFLRVVPSLAILLLMLPILGTGTAPAVTALVILGVPPVLLNTISGLENVPPFMLETAGGMGMKNRQIWLRVRFPLAMPMILTGVKTAAVEIVASATLAAKIGAGGFGEIIFTGIGLFKTDMLLIGGISVAVLSLLTGLIFDTAEKIFFKYGASPY